MNNLRTLIVSTLQIAIVKTLIRGDTSPYLAPAPALELETNLRKVRSFTIYSEGLLLVESAYYRFHVTLF